jgi:hypothetical protein
MSRRLQRTQYADMPATFAAEEVVEARKPESIIGAYDKMLEGDVDLATYNPLPWASRTEQKMFLKNHGFTDEDLVNFENELKSVDLSSITPEDRANAEVLAGEMDRLSTSRDAKDIALDDIRREEAIRLGAEERKPAGQFEVDIYQSMTDEQLAEAKQKAYNEWVEADKIFREAEGEFVGIMKPVYDVLAPVHARIVESAIKMQEEGAEEYGGVIEKWLTVLYQALTMFLVQQQLQHLGLLLGCLA